MKASPSRNITVGSMTKSDGFLTLESSDDQAPFSHCRYDAVEYIKTIKFSRKARKIYDTGVYCGPLFDHFGHFINECLPRVISADNLINDISAPLFFSSYYKEKILRPYMINIIESVGIDATRINILEEDTMFRELYFSAQIKTFLGSSVRHSFIEDIEERVSRNLTFSSSTSISDERIFFSRSRFSSMRNVFGENVIESFCKRNGFRIMYPEQHLPDYIMACIRNARMVIFTEGSAVHYLELCGKKIPDTFIISRRFAVRKTFDHILSKICDRYMISQEILFKAGVSSDRKLWSSFVDVRAVLEELSEFFGLGPVDISDTQIASGVLNDVARYLSDPAVPVDRGSTVVIDDFANALATALERNRKPASLA